MYCAARICERLHVCSDICTFISTHIIIILLTYLHVNNVAMSFHYLYVYLVINKY